MRAAKTVRLVAGAVLGQWLRIAIRSATLGREGGNICSGSNGIATTAHTWRMSTIDADTTMVIAGVILSLVAALELYPALQRNRAAEAEDR